MFLITAVHSACVQYRDGGCIDGRLENLLVVKYKCGGKWYESSVYWGKNDITDRTKAIAKGYFGMESLVNACTSGASHSSCSSDTVERVTNAAIVMRNKAWKRDGDKILPKDDSHSKFQFYHRNNEAGVLYSYKIQADNGKYVGVQCSDKELRAKYGFGDETWFYFQRLSDYII